MTETSDLWKRTAVQLEYAKQLLEECIRYLDKVITGCHEVDEFVKKVSAGIEDMEESNGSWDYEE